MAKPIKETEQPIVRLNRQEPEGWEMFDLDDEVEELEE